MELNEQEMNEQKVDEVELREENPNSEEGMTEEQIIDEYQKYFDKHLNTPDFITTIIAVFGGLTGLIMMPQDGLGLLVWLLTGIICLVTYFGLKQAYSYKILHIYYLKKLVGLKEKEFSSVAKEENSDSEEKAE